MARDVDGAQQPVGPLTSPGIGTYYGWYYLVSAVATVIVTAAVGALLDLDAAASRAAPFFLLTLIGLAGGASVASLQRRGKLERRETRTGRPQPG